MNKNICKKHIYIYVYIYTYIFLRAFILYCVSLLPLVWGVAPKSTKITQSYQIQIQQWPQTITLSGSLSN